MKLSDFLEQGGVGSAARLAAQIKVLPPDISNWARGIRPVPVKRCVQIEQATKNQVTRKDLRPDDYHLIWPELTKKQKRLCR